MKLLKKLGLSFVQNSPNCDEASYKLKINDPFKLCQTLAFEKAKSVAQTGNVTIGSDQVAVFEGTVLDKPGNFENAFGQLKKLNGQSHQLLTAVCVLDGLNVFEAWVNTCTLRMKPLTDLQIQNYLNTDQPYDTCGSYKIEEHGISLFDSIECSDWSAIEGLPLLELSKALDKLGPTGSL
jgi:septum formation protein